MHMCEQREMFGADHIQNLGDTKLLPSTPDDVSPITSINGENAVSFLKKFSLKSWSQDPDAQ